MSTTTATPDGAPVDTLGQMAALLQEPAQEATTQEEQIEEPTQEEPTQEELAQEEPAQEEQPSDVTWGGTLGLDDKNVILDDAGNFKAVKVKVDGRESEVNMQDLVAGYQTAKYNTQKSQALAEESRQFNELKNSVVQAYTQKLESVTKLANYLEQSFLRDFNGIDWDTLRTTNAGEYAALVQDLGIRKNELQKIYSTIEQERLTEVQALQQTQEEQIAGRLQDEVAKALEKNPTWQDVTVFKKDVEELKTFVEEAYGFTSTEFDTIHDHRLLELVKDAMRYKKNTQVAASKLQKPVPKFQSTQTRNAKVVSKLDVLTNAAKNARGYEKVSKQTDAIAELLNTI